MPPTGLRIRSTMSQSVAVFEMRTVFAKWGGRGKVVFFGAKINSKK